MMTVDTRNGLMAVIATAALALVVVGALIGIIVMAVTHDGPLSAEAMDTFKQILLGAGAGGVLLGIVERITNASTASKAISAGASVQGSPVSVTAAPPTGPLTGEPTNDVGGVTVSGDGV